ncbi:radical SAM family heme chaperone HemW [Schaalia vaccimaxillae]|uniref:radical SAM family heme chaperone HemW n=1 Tax=Schaalia vaccimaxillae TaxID=183916 RepID=UPI0003B47C2A|nr:radical SAM family heme chaperone HemW [Schaalia vaccimaxillae]
MSPSQPDGIAWPADGSVDPVLVESESDRPLSLYVHVPFCRVRCGYCDFNTYTTGFGPGAEPGAYASSVLTEANLATSILERAGMPARPASTVFFGGGTPTMLDAGELGAILAGLRDSFGIAEGAEITTEANPDTVDHRTLQALADAGFTRISFGMQSAVPHVLRTLDRTHDPRKVPEVVDAARAVGLDVSVDLIYGTPGETLSDWRRSLESALEMNPDHISAYALVIEEGTKMWGQVSRGELPTPEPDDEAAKYEIADDVLAEAGYRWYEISNFARVDEDEADIPAAQLRHASRHNLAYWHDWDWWGLGPGAHSHIGRYRWWNAKHPLAYAGRVSGGASPASAGEVLDADTRSLETVLLNIRTAEGVAIGDAVCPDTVDELVADGLIEEASLRRGRVILTLRGRLLADRVTGKLMGF